MLGQKASDDEILGRSNEKQQKVVRFNTVGPQTSKGKVKMDVGKKRLNIDLNESGSDKSLKELPSLVSINNKDFNPLNTELNPVNQVTIATPSCYADGGSGALTTKINKFLVFGKNVERGLSELKKLHQGKHRLRLSSPMQNPSHNGSYN